MGAEGDGSSEDEEEIRAWLDNRDWNGMSTLVCGEDLEGCTNLNTLQEVFDQERILTLMDTSDSPTPNILEEDSEGVPTAPLTPASTLQRRRHWHRTVAHPAQQEVLRER